MSGRQLIGTYFIEPDVFPSPAFFSEENFMETCKDCKYSQDGECPVVVWENGIRYRIGPVDDEQDGCGMWEEKEK